MFYYLCKMWYCRQPAAMTSRNELPVLTTFAGSSMDSIVCTITQRSMSERAKDWRRSWARFQRLPGRAWTKDAGREWQLFGPRLRAWCRSHRSGRAAISAAVTRSHLFSDVIDVQWTVIWLHYWTREWWCVGNVCVIYFYVLTLSVNSFVRYDDM